jgi:hypothetical protein
MKFLNLNVLWNSRVPKNLHFLTDKLPKSNYSLIKENRIDKSDYFPKQVKSEDNIKFP